ncbi:gliding motility-associated C-terminal domain-containing protein [Ulvibacterium sp.]|uniref:gliding motility-associated C-terminal domain-containing protein n=1 Tax=Ulvibacterium sp. TaxID=2665914 RepID=UPI00262AE670|nr:gliding motility-associated C-terminal domain-containing protein [Ulvibacterium sp.]
MRKIVRYNTIFFLALLWAFGLQIAQAQCDPNTFTVTVTEGTCPSDGNIAVTLPGGSPCVGWQAILTNPGGLETVLNVPDTGGPVNFSNLAVGSYMVRLVNGGTVIQSPDNPIAVTSTYQAMNITSTNTAPSCPSGTDATLTIDINSGGNGPFEYTVTPPAPGLPQTFGPTPNTSHTFLGLNGGETVSFEVTDLGCSVSQTQNPVIADNTALPSEYFNATFQRKCSPNCGAYDVTFFTRVYTTDGITAIQQAGNATISINGGAQQNLVLDNVNGNIISFTHPPGINANVPYTITFNDGCSTFGTTKTTLPVDDGFLVIDQEIAYPPDCSVIHRVDAIGLTSDGPDIYNMFCPTNSISIEQEIPVGSNIWTNVPLVGGAFNPLNNNFVNYYTLPGEGSYRLTGIDDCHSTSVEFNTLPTTNPLDAIRIQSALSILEGTGGFTIDRAPGQFSSNVFPETTYTIRPVPFQSSITINPTQPFNLGGPYTLNFPLTYTTTTNRSIIGDLPPGEYEITATDICGNLSVHSHTISSTAQYTPEITAFSGCANSGRIEYDMNALNVANSIGPPRVNTIVELWTDDGSGTPGTLLTDDIPEARLTGSFNNLTAGDYVIRFSNINFQSTNANEVFSAATGNNADREYWTTVTIAPFQSITAATAGAFCDFTDPNTGIIFTEITGGTPTYPINYELFATSDLVNPVMTHVETDPSMTSHLFENVAAGNYIVRLTTPCDGVDLNINLITAPITTIITADNNPICAPGGDVELSINLPTSIFDITWTDNLGNTVGLGSPVTVTVNATTTYTASYAIKPIFCPTAPSNTNSITITVNPDIVQVGTETSSCNLLGTEYTLVTEVAGTGPFSATGTGAPGSFAGNIWTSDPIPAGTDYSIDFTDSNTCNILTISGTAPNCCIFDLNLTTSDIDLCLNPGPYETIIANTTLGLIYEVRDQNGISFSPALTGIGNGGDLSINIPTLNVPAGGTDYQVFVTNGVPGCSGILGDPVSFSNGNSDTFLNVTGDTVCEGDPATVTLSNSQVGITYQLQQSGIPLNPAVTGTGTGGDLMLTIPAGHPQLATGTYDVEASGSGCSTVTLNQSPIITVNALPTLSITSPAACSPDLTTYSLEVTVSNGTVSSTFGNVTNTSGNTWSITSIGAGTNIVVTLTDTNGCISTLNINAPDCSCPVVNEPITGGDQSYCIGSSVPSLVAVVDPGETVDWYSAPTGGTLLSSGNTTYIPTSPGTYYAETRNIINGCTSTTRTPIQIIENNLPIVTFNDPATICLNTGALDLTAFATPVGGNFGGPGVTGNNFNPALSGTGIHTLTYEFTDANGCTNSDTAQISVNAPLAQIGSETTSCALDGQSYVLTVELNGAAPFNVSGSGAPGTFTGNLWTSDPIPSGTDYSTNFTDVNGCNTVSVMDNAPVCCVFEVACPTFPATTVACYEDIPTANRFTETEFEALGNADGIIGDIPCGIIEITASNSPDMGNCNMIVERTYTITEYEDTNRNGIRDLGEDIVRNTVNCTQNITVQDTTGPVFVEALPMDFTMQCDTDLPIAETLTATDNCGGATVTYNEEVLNNGCAGSYTILRTWEATDTCGNQTIHVQTIAVEDTSAPVFVETLPQDGFADCGIIPEAAILTATDNCGAATVDFTETEIPGNCSSQYNLVRTWTATDACGNETSHTQTIQLACPVKIYNAVSANGNGQNDIFLLEGIDCFPNNQVEIFNRWGVKVFETNGYDNQNKVFKGYSEGRLTLASSKKLPTGTYFYIVQYESMNGGESQTIQESGYLYLISDN